MMHGKQICSIELKRYERGVAIFGAVPLALFESILEFIGAQDHQFAPGVANALGANFVLAAAEDIEPWCQELEQLLEQTHPDPVERWPHSTTTGRSSEALYQAILGREQHRKDLPMDLSDFERCCTMLEYTGLDRELARERLPEWNRLLDSWDAIVATARDDRRAAYTMLKEATR